MSEKKVRDLMSDQVWTIQQNDQVLKAAQLMKDHDTGFLPVMDGQKLSGAITDRDLVLRVLAGKLPYEMTIKQVMTSAADTIEADATAEEAAETMARLQIRRLIVTERGHVSGVISIGDLAGEPVMQQETAKAIQHISSR